MSSSSVYTTFALLKQQLSVRKRFVFKGIVHPNIKLCHHLLTLKLYEFISNEFISSIKQYLQTINLDLKGYSHKNEMTSSCAKPEWISYFFAENTRRYFEKSW